MRRTEEWLLGEETELDEADYEMAEWEKRKRGEIEQTRRACDVPRSKNRRESKKKEKEKKQYTRTPDNGIKDIF